MVTAYTGQWWLIVASDRTFIITIDKIPGYHFSSHEQWSSPRRACLLATLWSLLNRLELAGSLVGLLAWCILLGWWPQVHAWSLSPRAVAHRSREDCEEGRLWIGKPRLLRRSATVEGSGKWTWKSLGFSHIRFIMPLVNRECHTYTYTKRLCHTYTSTTCKWIRLKPLLIEEIQLPLIGKKTRPAQSTNCNSHPLHIMYSL